MRDLDQRIKELTARLSLLSEAPSQKLLPKVTRPHADSRPPAGSDPERKNLGPDDSLLDYFLERLEKVETDTARVALVAEVEIRLAKRVDAKVQRATAGAINVAAPTDTDERDCRIARDYVGLHPAEVSAVETEASGWCSQANVRKVRIQHGRDPETGEMREQALNEREYVRELKANGVSVRSIALRLGKPKSTIQDWLKDTNGEDKAA